MDQRRNCGQIHTSFNTNRRRTMSPHVPERRDCDRAHSPIIGRCAAPKIRRVARFFTRGGELKGFLYRRKRRSLRRRVLLSIDGGLRKKSRARRGAFRWIADPKRRPASTVDTLYGTARGRRSRRPLAQQESHPVESSWRDGGRDACRKWALMYVTGRAPRPLQPQFASTAFQSFNLGWMINSRHGRT